MNILDAYKKYQIPPNLQRHQLQVAAVATQLINHFPAKKELNKRNIQAAMLLHDMGNIIKFDLSLSPELLGGKGLEYWKGIQDQFIHKYGRDEHKATLAIAQELAVPERVIYLIDQVGFNKSISNLNCKDWEVWIVAYSDSRVTPYGVTSLLERLDDGVKRYAKNKQISPLTLAATKSDFGQLAAALQEIEAQIFAQLTGITPKDITTESTETLIPDLEKFELVF